MIEVGRGRQISVDESIPSPHVLSPEPPEAGCVRVEYYGRVYKAVNSDNSDLTIAGEWICQRGFLRLTESKRLLPFYLAVCPITNAGYSDRDILAVLGLLPNVGMTRRNT